MCCPDMSPSAPSFRCSVPWPSTAQSTTVVNLSLPIYFPFMSHYRVTLSAKKSFSGSLPLSLVCSPSIWHKSNIFLPACLPTHPASHTSILHLSWICKERFILEWRFLSTHITLSTQWFLEQSQCAVQFYFLTVTERTPDTTRVRKYRERNTQTKVSLGL